MNISRKKNFIFIACLVVFVSCLFLVASILILSKFDLDNVKNQQEDVQLFTRKMNYKIRNGGLGLNNGVYEIEELDTSEMMFQPDFGWIKIYKGKVSEYALYFLDSDKDVGNKLEKGSYYINCYVQKVGDKVTCEELPSNVVVNVKDYGAKGNVSLYLNNPNDLIVDNVPEDLKLSDLQKVSLLETKAIQKAVAEVNKTGGVLYFPYGTYFISVNDFSIPEGWPYKKNIFLINSEKPIIVECGFSTIKQTGYAYPYNFPEVNLFEVLNSNSVEIKNGTIIGDRREHDYDPWRTSKGVVVASTHEFGYGVALYNTKNGVVKNLNIKEFIGDAVVIQNGAIAKSTGQTYKTTIINCDLSYCRRQGISVLDSDINIIENCAIHNIGHSDVFVGDAKYGTDPMFGIDVEPRSGSGKAELVEVTGTKIKKCTGAGLGSVSDLAYKADIKVYGSEIDALSVSDALIEDSKISYHDYNYTNDNDAVFHSCTFNNVAFEFVNLPKFCLTLRAMKDEINNPDNKGCVLNNCLFKTSIDAKKESSRLSFLGKNEVNGSVFENFIGYKSENQTFYYGLALDDSVAKKINSSSFKNCKLDLKTILFEQGSMEDCYLLMEGVIGLKTIEFKNCNFDVTADTDFSIEGCKIDDSELIVNANAKVDFENSGFYKCNLEVKTAADKVDNANCTFESCTLNLWGDTSFYSEESKFYECKLNLVAAGAIMDSTECEFKGVSFEAKNQHCKLNYSGCDFYGGSLVYKNYFGVGAEKTFVIGVNVTVGKDEETVYIVKYENCKVIDEVE